MQFGDIPLNLRPSAQFSPIPRAHPSGMLKKGRVLSPADIEKLKSAGITSIIAARLADQRCARR